MVFEGNYRNVGMYLSFQFQMKKERKICEFKVDLLEF